MTGDDTSNAPSASAPAPRKRVRKTARTEHRETASNEVAEQSVNSSNEESSIPGFADFPGEILSAPASSENAIGTLGTNDPAVESSGGDPNSPADSALTSALEREQQLASHMVNFPSNSATAVPDLAQEEYPGEHDPIEDPAFAPQTDEKSETGRAPVASSAPIDPQHLERTIEALLFAAMEPITVREMARAADSDSATVRNVIKALKETGDRERRPWDLVEVANAYRLVTRAEFHPAIQRLKTQTSQRKLTQAALETLALIAYRQPIGRAEIESVRGVNVGPVLRLLLEKKLIQISGRGTGIGQPLLYGTTDYFLENFGLKNVNELPKPGEFKNA